MWVWVGAFSNRLFPATAQIRPKFVFFSDTFTSSEGPYRYLRIKILWYYSFYHVLRGGGAFLSFYLDDGLFFPFNSAPLARTLIGDQTLSVYFTYFIAQRVTKLSNEYTLFDPIILHNHNIKMYIKTFLLLAVSRVVLAAVRARATDSICDKTTM